MEEKEINTEIQEVEVKDHEIVTKTSTPLHTIDWYIKWVASVILVTGNLLTSNGITPWNIYITAIGAFGWLIVSIIWNDRALIIINAIAFAFMINGAFQSLIK